MWQNIFSAQMMILASKSHSGGTKQTLPPAPSGRPPGVREQRARRREGEGKQASRMPPGWVRSCGNVVKQLDDGLSPPGWTTSPTPPPPPSPPRPSSATFSNAPAKDERGNGRRNDLSWSPFVHSSDSSHYVALMRQKGVASDEGFRPFRPSTALPNDLFCSTGKLAWPFAARTCCLSAAA